MGLVRFLRLLGCALPASSLVFTADCLVIDTIDFEPEENIPASISSAPSATQEGTSLSQIVTIELDADDSTPTEKRFPVVVRDANRRQNLVWQVFLNFKPDFPQPAIGGDQLPATSDQSIERSLVYTLPFSRLQGPGCYRLELLVSSLFVQRFPFREPETPDDLAIAVWWLYVSDEQQPTVDFRTCP